MPLGLKVTVRDPAGLTIVSYVVPLDGALIAELPRVPIAVNGLTAGFPAMAGMVLDATWETVELDDDEVEHWRAWGRLTNVLRMVPIPGRVDVSAQLLHDLVKIGNELADESMSGELADRWMAANAAVARELTFRPVGTE